MPIEIIMIVLILMVNISNLILVLVITRDVKLNKSIRTIHPFIDSKYLEIFERRMGGK